MSDKGARHAKMTCPMASIIEASHNRSRFGSAIVVKKNTRCHRTCYRSSSHVCMIDCCTTFKPRLSCSKLLCLVTVRVDHRFRSVVAMFALYKQSEGYIANEIAMFGAEGELVKRSVRARIMHMRDVVPSLARDFGSRPNSVTQME